MGEKLTARALARFGIRSSPACEKQGIAGPKDVGTTMVHVRVDQKTKQSAAKTLAGMGLSVSDAVRMLLVRVAAEAWRRIRPRFLWA